MSGINFKNIADDFQKLANSHKQLNSFGLGNSDQLSYWTTSRDKEYNTQFQPPYYPLLYVVPGKVINDLEYKTWEMNTITGDVLQRDLRNDVDISSDTLQILQDVISQWRLSVTQRFGNYYENYFVDDEVVCTPFLDMEDDMLNGWNGLIKIKTRTPLNRCDAAFETFTGTPIQHLKGINFKSFHDDFRLLADHHKQINSFGFGSVDEFQYSTQLRDKEENVHSQPPYYPLMYVVPNDVIQKFGFMEYKFDVIVADIIQRDLANQTDVLSDTNQIMDDIISQFRLSVTDSLGNFNNLYYLDNPVTCVPFIEEYDDLLGGWTMTMSIQVMTPLDRCDAAFVDTFVTPTPTVTPTNTPTPSITPSMTPTSSETPTPTPSVTQTMTPTNSQTPTRTPDVTPTPTNTETPTNTPTQTNTPTTTLTLTPTGSGTPTPTPSVTQTMTPTLTQTPTNTPASCIWNFTVVAWDNNTNNWNSCGPIPTPTMTPTTSLTPSPTQTPGLRPTFTNLWDWWISDSGVSTNSSLGITGWTGINGNILTPQTSGREAQYLTTDTLFNNKPSVHVNTGVTLNAGYQVLTSSGQTSKTIMMVGYVVNQNKSGTNQSPIIGIGTGTTPRMTLFGMTTNQFDTYTNDCGEVYTGSTWSTGYTFSRITYNRTFGGASFFYSSANTFNTAIAIGSSLCPPVGRNFTSGNLEIGVYDAAGYQNTPSMKIVEFLLIDGIPTSAELSAYSTYLNFKYNI